MFAFSGARDPTTGRGRQVTIRFYCNPRVPLGTPKFVQQQKYEYVFDFQTSLACSAKAVQCSVTDNKGKKYDLTPLGQASGKTNDLVENLETVLFFLYRLILQLFLNDFLVHLSWFCLLYFPRTKRSKHTVFKQNRVLVAWLVYPLWLLQATSASIYVTFLQNINTVCNR